MAKKIKSDKAVTTDFITAILNLIAVLLGLITWLLERGE